MKCKKEARPEREPRHRPAYKADRQQRRKAQDRSGPGRPAAEGTDTNQGRLSLGELTEAADVSVRTVRYYIAEGLLPPPEGSGPASAYALGHLDRLRLIQRMKAAYLPLKEIRRQLAGLSDAEVRMILMDEADGPSTEPRLAAPMDASLAGARDYLALLESRARYRAEPMALPFAAPAEAADDFVAEEDAAFTLAERSSGRLNRQPVAHRPRGEQDARDAAPSEEGLWRRIPLGDGAELVISDRVYARHRDRIDWLVRWARKVFD